MRYLFSLAVILGGLTGLAFFVWVVLLVFRDAYRIEAAQVLLDDASTCRNCSTRWVRPGWEVEIQHCAWHAQSGRGVVRLLCDGRGHPYATG